MTILGQNIRYLRQKAGLSQAKFGAQIGASKDFIWTTETQELRECCLHDKLAKHLGYELSFLKNNPIMPQPANKREINATCEEIERKMILQGHCIKTNIKFNYKDK